MTLHDRALRLQTLLADIDVPATVAECEHLILCQFIEDVRKKNLQNA